ncbi:MAG: hypothetical protein ACOZBW_13220 [Thermodesulfobacteriota bacterium]
MNHDTILAQLNLWAVLPNLEELVRLDATAADMVRDWNICIQFGVPGGPAAFVRFANGACETGTGKHPAPDVRLMFVSCRHINAMFENKGIPIPLKGFTRLGFLSKEFSAITKRMEYFLKPTDALLENADYAAVNTLLTLHTAGRAVSILAGTDPQSRAVASGMPDGALMMKVLPDGPAVTLNVEKGRLSMQKGETRQPAATLVMKDMATANRLLNQKIDPFTAIALGDVKIRGLVPMIDAVDLLLDRIPHYLKP